MPAQQMPQSHTFILTGGGTGGHIMPALAVAAELRTRGHQVVFIGTRTGMEARLVPGAGFPIEWISIGGLNRVSLGQRLRTAGQLPFSIAGASGLLRKHRPAAVFSTGGFVAGPVMLAAAMHRLPLVIMEPNAVPGMANRSMGGMVNKALVNFPETLRHFPPGRAELAGVPVRPEFLQIGLRPFPPERAAFHLLVTGGSRGSQSLNRAMRESWRHFAAAAGRLRITHQTGTEMYTDLAEGFAASGLSGVVVPFLPDMAAAFAEADLVLCRSGASTVSELAASGRPAILVPFPFAADDHQLRNAESLVQAGAARLLLDRDLSGEALAREVLALAVDRNRLEAMAAAALSLARPQALPRAVEVLEEVARPRLAGQ